MIYRILYSSGLVSCNLPDYSTVLQFANIMATNPVYPVLIIKIKSKK
jgi:hypothetical protein